MRLDSSASERSIELPNLVVKLLYMKKKDWRMFLEYSLQRVLLTRQKVDGESQVLEGNCYVIV